MSSLFDRLQNELGDSNEEKGVSPVDLLGLPDQLRRIMVTMIKARKMSRKEIIALVESWPAKNQINTEELDKILQELVDQGWLFVMGEADYIGYRLNFRRKQGKKLDSSIWGALENKIEGRIEEQRKLADKMKEQRERKRPDNKETDTE